MGRPESQLPRSKGRDEFHRKQFTDAGATDHVRRFYQLRSP